tara:strand:- start:425 stop:1054 length:630 start_codon:yes stop_codon:yes gene_type:complete
MIFPRNTQDSLIRLAEEKKILLEGNILKVLEYDGNDQFAEYVQTCKDTDKAKRKQRLDVTKQVQSQNKELDRKAKELELQSKQLLAKAEENETLMADLKSALQEAEKAAELAENAKKEALNDLDFIQQKTQFELIGNIVQVALWVIMGVGVIVTGMYALAMFHQTEETTLIGNTWSNLFGILLTNSFSIIGTIMGVKYASENTNKEEKK